MSRIYTLLWIIIIGTFSLSANAADTLPAPIAALEAQGIKVVDSFQAPAGLTGYAALLQGKPIAIYLTSDNKHAIVGTLIDAKGDDLSHAALEKRVEAPRNQAIWDQLADSDWVLDGDSKAKRVVYMFSDPNCPYCHKFWQMARPWVDAGSVQVRHVLVGLLKPSSLPKAATIMAADDPSATLDRNERHYKSGGIELMDNIDDEWAAKVKKNTLTMLSFDLHATPSIFYQTSTGKIEMVQGAPQSEEQLNAIMGSKKP